MWQYIRWRRVLCVFLFVSAPITVFLMLVEGIGTGAFFIDTFFIDIAAGFGITLLATITWLLLVLGPNVMMGGIVVGSAVAFGIA